MNNKVVALKSICKKIDDKIKVMETKLFSEQNDIDHTEVNDLDINKEKISIYKYNIN
jgi:hypothetical protein